MSSVQSSGNSENRPLGYTNGITKKTFIGFLVQFAWINTLVNKIKDKAIDLQQRIVVSNQQGPQKKFRNKPFISFLKIIIDCIDAATENNLKCRNSDLEQREVEKQNTSSRFNAHLQSLPKDELLAYEKKLQEKIKELHKNTELTQSNLENITNDQLSTLENCMLLLDFIQKNYCDAYADTIYLSDEEHKEWQECRDQQFQKHVMTNKPKYGCVMQLTKTEALALTCFCKDHNLKDNFVYVVDGLKFEDCIEYANTLKEYEILQSFPKDAKKRLEFKCDQCKCLSVKAKFNEQLEAIKKGPNFNRKDFDFSFKQFSIYAHIPNKNACSGFAVDREGLKNFWKNNTKSELYIDKNWSKVNHFEKNRTKNIPAYEEKHKEIYAKFDEKVPRPLIDAAIKYKHEADLEFIAGRNLQTKMEFIDYGKQELTRSKALAFVSFCMEHGDITSLTNISIGSKGKDCCTLLNALKETNVWDSNLIDDEVKETLLFQADRYKILLAKTEAETQVERGWYIAQLKNNQNFQKAYEQYNIFAKNTKEITDSKLDYSTYQAMIKNQEGLKQYCIEVNKDIDKKFYTEQEAAVLVYFCMYNGYVTTLNYLLEKLFDSQNLNTFLGVFKKFNMLNTGIISDEAKKMLLK